jgi:hypothetical protein
VVNRPSVPEIITVNSEGLQAQIRDLLPSQNGFGSELQASNVITPIIDLTRAAEGSIVGENLQTAIAFGSQTAFDVRNTTTVIANSTGFFRMICGIASYSRSGAAESALLKMSDGISTKTVWGLNYSTFLVNQTHTEKLDLTFFLAAGQDLSWTCTNAMQCVGSIRQIATGDGTLVNPNGFPL